MKVRINGEDRHLDGPAKVGDVVAKLGLSERRVAVELNREVIDRERWMATVVNENDEIEIIQFVGGG